MKKVHSCRFFAFTSIFRGLYSSPVFKKPIPYSSPNVLPTQSYCCAFTHDTFRLPGSHFLGGCRGVDSDPTSHYGGLVVRHHGLCASCSFVQFAAVGDRTRPRHRRSVPLRQYPRRIAGPSPLEQAVLTVQPDDRQAHCKANHPEKDCLRQPARMATAFHGPKRRFATGHQAANHFPHDRPVHGHHVTTMRTTNQRHEPPPRASASGRYCIEDPDNVPIKAYNPEYQHLFPDRDGLTGTPNPPDHGILCFDQAKSLLWTIERRTTTIFTKFEEQRPRIAVFPAQVTPFTGVPLVQPSHPSTTGDDP